MAKPATDDHPGRGAPSVTVGSRFCPCACRETCQGPDTPSRPSAGGEEGGAWGQSASVCRSRPAFSPGCQLEDHVGCDPFVSLAGKKKCAPGKNSIVKSFKNKHAALEPMAREVVSLGSTWRE